MEFIKNKSSLSTPLTIALIAGKLFYLRLEIKNKSSKIAVYESSDAKKFAKTTKKFVIKNLEEKFCTLERLTYLHISSKNKEYIGIIGFGNKFFSAKSKTGLSWQLLEVIPKIFASAAIIPSYSYQEKDVLFWASKDIHVGFSKDNSSWQLFDDPIFSPSLGHNQSMKILNAFNANNEIFVPFAIETKMPAISYFSLSVAVFSKYDPRKVAWRIAYPIWSVPEDIVDNILCPLAVVEFKKEIYSFWQGRGDGEVLSIKHAILKEIVFDKGKEFSFSKLKKADHNPILSPDPNHSWESKAVFNPASLYDEENKKVHFLYRAVGDDWTSVLGYASSNDGLHIDFKHHSPAYIPRASFEGASVIPDPNSPFTSGPGTGGCEDPRLTRLGNKVYLTYVAYNGITGPRVALSSISNDDFNNHSWNKWSDPVLISKPNVIDKNACIFPETINGKYVIMHRIFPHILIDFVDNLDFNGKTFLKGEHKIAPRTHGWDSRKVGAGPPPVKTPYGWLLIYHAVDDKHDNKYQIGAMLLDLKDPTKVLHRSSQPIISPTHWYENDGHKSGVVYPCGASIINDNLHVYYGGADTYVCAATAKLPEFMDRFMSHENLKMERLEIV
ncbi:hypothetical protein C4559_02395 [Candidatus Microgenomates bacterium]|nr:MAG: hypothetical protein C4559_02395 [Candidatus Microgenomates bacterium]